MRKKGFAALSLSAAALLTGGSGALAHAEEAPKFSNDTQILSCFSLEILDIPVASAANNSIDCSKNHHSEQSRSVTYEGRR
ncbi:MULTISPECIES: hypothetical protein [Streptomyces]|uniref:Uncharacterized protein n=1 Tax=Streptomyces sudanensis TaxID=436397 RepID=A0ABY4TCL8_9ACTN|nr:MULTISPECIES: hypothetical protein [Streptomyces]MCP9987508.1 hypothetical protein [Streptomyces sudanensis]MCQ0001110.1 hypothetical protein [Streptomyces sudanensis]URN16701.1 hypothetical protein MW084_12940 [Streptomyces sudanensis]